MPAQLAPRERRYKYEKVNKCESRAGRLVHRGTIGEEGTGDEVTEYVVVAGTVNERCEECK